MLAKAGDCGGVGDVTVGVATVSVSIGAGIVTVGLASALGDPCFASCFVSETVFGSTISVFDVISVSVLLSVFGSLAVSVSTADSAVGCNSGSILLSLAGSTFSAGAFVGLVNSIGAKLESDVASFVNAIVGIGEATSDILRTP